jgi:hypothetical protein
MSERLYLPATLATLAEYAERGEIPADVDGLTSPDETEDGEYATLMEAAAASRALLDGPGRRVVLVAEVEHRGRPVPLDRVVAVHVDTVDGAAEDDDLAWYATQEIPDLISAT